MKNWIECRYLKNRIKNRYCDKYAKELCTYVDFFRKYKSHKKIKEVMELSNSILNRYYWSMYNTLKGFGNS